MKKIGPIRVLVCGSRDWRDEEWIRRVLSLLAPGSVVIHGGARGADSIAGRIAKELGLEVEVYPADWTKYGRGAGPRRNEEMLREGRPEWVYAFDLGTPGTADMLRRAKAALAVGDVHGVGEFNPPPRRRLRVPSFPSEPV